MEGSLSASTSDALRSPGEASTSTRAGYIAILGPPNAGKSTLLNRLVGTKLSIVSPRPQTTWKRVTGLRTEAGTQMIFLDTPGLLSAGSLLDRSLMEEARRALEDADVHLVVVDAEAGRAREGVREAFESLGNELRAKRAPVLVALNKVDAAAPEHLDPVAADVSLVLEPDEMIRISALHGEGLSTLLEALRARLPESPFLFPEEDLATAPVRFFVAELVRETVFEQFRDEIPYATFCQVEEFREDPERTYIHVILFVERPSQKGILIGKGGAAIRALGTRAREKIEHFVGGRVYLDLWIKVLPRWRKKRNHLRRLGFPVPDHDP